MYPCLSSLSARARTPEPLLHYVLCKHMRMGGDKCPGTRSARSACNASHGNLANRTAYFKAGQADFRYCLWGLSLLNAQLQKRAVLSALHFKALDALCGPILPSLDTLACMAFSLFLSEIQPPRYTAESFQKRKGKGLGKPVDAADVFDVRSRDNNAVSKFPEKKDRCKSCTAAFS